MALTRCNENIDLQGAIVKSGTLSILWDDGVSTPVNPFDDARLSFVHTILMDLTLTSGITISGIAVLPHGTELQFFLANDNGGSSLATFREQNATSPAEDIICPPSSGDITLTQDGCIVLWYDATYNSGVGAWRVKSYTQ